MHGLDLRNYVQRIDTILTIVTPNTHVPGRCQLHASNLQHWSNESVDGSPAFVKEEAAFSSHRDFVSRLDEMMECQTPWEAVTIADKDARESWAADLRYWKRDSLAVLQEILENTALVDKCVWGPSKWFNADNERVYTHMDSGDWWWNMQALTPLKDILMLGKNASY